MNERLDELEAQARQMDRELRYMYRMLEELRNEAAVAVGHGAGGRPVDGHAAD